MRIAKWDNVKFFLMFCVVFGHLAAVLKTDSSFLKGLHLFVYTFHMPAFLFVSGLFSKRAIKERRYDRMVSYLLLYIWIKVFIFLSYAMMGKSHSFHLFRDNGVPWFALTLFLCYLLTVVVDRWDARYALGLTVLLGILAGYDTDLGGFLTGMRLFTFYPFFLLGYYLSPEKIKEFTDKKAVRIAAVLILLCSLLICYAANGSLYGGMDFLRGKASYKAMELLPWGGFYRGIYYPVTVLLIFCVIAVIPSVSWVCSKWGKRTIQVFVLHYPVMKFLTDICHLEKGMRFLWPSHYALLVPFIALAITALLSIGIFERVFNRMVNPFCDRR